MKDHSTTSETVFPLHLTGGDPLRTDRTQLSEPAQEVCCLQYSFQGLGHVHKRVSN
jgi:hypothetical protein